MGAGVMTLTAMPTRVGSLPIDFVSEMIVAFEAL